jgi:hypothetical protein
MGVPEKANYRVSHFPGELGAWKPRTPSSGGGRPAKDPIRGTSRGGPPHSEGSHREKDPQSRGHPAGRPTPPRGGLPVTPCATVLLAAQTPLGTLTDP